MDNVVIDVLNKGRNIVVAKRDDVYDVIVDGQVRHPGCTAEAVMRALAMYLHEEIR